MGYDDADIGVEEIRGKLLEIMPDRSGQTRFDRLMLVPAFIAGLLVGVVAYAQFSPSREYQVSQELEAVILDISLRSGYSPSVLTDLIVSGVSQK